jgi:hypothetical protein
MDGDAQMADFLPQDFRRLIRRPTRILTQNHSPTANPALSIRVTEKARIH